MNIKIINLIIALSFFFAQTGAASYAGDRIEVYQHEMIQGGLDFTIGDSRYSGEIPAGNVYNVNFDAPLPDVAKVKSARLYLYWVWSHSGNEGAIPEIETRFQDNSLIPDREYVDSKGNGSYNYPSGTYAFDVTSFISKDGIYSASVKNTGGGKTFAVNGMGLLVIYEDGKQEVEYWIGEGADMIYATQGIDADEAVTKVDFEDIDSYGSADEAILITVVPGGNRGKNSLYFNNKSWDGVYDGKPYADLAIDNRNVNDYLQPKNTIKIRDDGDYMTPSNAIILVKYSPPTATSQKTSSKMAGFELVATIGMLAMACRIGRRKNND